MKQRSRPFLAVVLACGLLALVFSLDGEFKEALPKSGRVGVVLLKNEGDSYNETTSGATVSLFVYRTR